VLLVAGDTGDLIRVAVDHACRRQGTGSRLVGAILVEARSIGLDTVFLEVAAGNSAAIALYERHRFAPIDRRVAYYPDGSDALVMRCELQQRSASFEEGATHVR
jgi:ribosomal-protein-alanine N-acetyltransferase